VISKPTRGSLINKTHQLSPDVLCLPFNDLSGDSLYDLTGNLRHGAINGSLTWRDGLTFNGNEANFVAVPNMAAFFANATEFTIITETIWGSSTADETIFDMSDIVGLSWYKNSLILFGDDVGGSGDDIVSLFVGVDATIYRLESAAGVKAAGAKTHIVITYKAPTIRMYINGIEDANSPVTGPSTIDSGLIDNAWIGKSHAASGGQKPHQGSINYLYANSRMYTAAEAFQSYIDPHSFLDTGFNPAIFGGLASGATTYQDSLALAQIHKENFNSRIYINHSLSLSNLHGQGLNTAVTLPTSLVVSLSLAISELSTQTMVELFNLNIVNTISNTPRLKFNVNFPLNTIMIFSWITEIDTPSLWVNVLGVTAVTWKDITTQSGDWIDIAGQGGSWKTLP